MSAVQVVLQGGTFRFTSGWHGFIEGEKIVIVKGSHGFLCSCGPNIFEFRLFGQDGAYKPIYLCFPCHVIVIFVLSFISISLSALDHLMGMQFELGPKISMCGALLQAMHNVWI